MALIAIGFYILEGAVLAVSITESFSLLRISQEYATAANPALQMMRQVAYVWALPITIGFVEILAFVTPAEVGNARWQVNFDEYPITVCKMYLT
jgi:hypothetical protein